MKRCQQACSYLYQVQTESPRAHHMLQLTLTLRIPRNKRVSIQLCVIISEEVNATAITVVSCMGPVCTDYVIM